MGLAPAIANADPPSSTITSWTSSQNGSPANGSYLISYDNPPSPQTPTTLTVEGQASGIATVDIACFYGAAGSADGESLLAAGVPVTGGTFSDTAALRPIAGHACRLRAIPTGGGTADDLSQYAGPQVAVSEVALPSGAVAGTPYDFSVIAATLAGTAAWDSAGSCGPYAAPFDSSFGQGNFAIDCAGSLLGENLASGATRSEVQVDGHNAFDAASAEALFGGTSLPSLNASVNQDPTDGSVTSQSIEGWDVCLDPIYTITCNTLANAGVQLQRDITTSDGGLVVKMTDTWSSTDGQPHSLDLLYDDVVGLKSSNTTRGYEFPGQTTFSGYQAGTTEPSPGPGPGSILVRTNLAAADGATSEAAGAITYSTAPTGFTFAGNNELEEHQTLEVPATGGVSLTYVYSTGYTVAQVQALARAAEDGLEAPAVTISSPASGTTVSTQTADVTGTAVAGSGITSLLVAGQTVDVAPGGSWHAEVPLSPGSNTITAVATDAAGASTQSQVTVVYQPLVQGTGLPPVVASSVCKAPRIKGMKLPAAERAIRRAHCQVGRIRHERSKKVRQGRVISTSPAAGRQFRAGWKVELFVSKGP